MPHINQLSSSPWLKPIHLDGEQWHCIIDRVEFEEFKDGDSTERKAVLCLKGWTKKLTLNKTNLEQIAAVTGKPNTDDWAGHALTMFVMPKVYGDKDGVRFLNKAPDVAVAAEAPIPEACRPFDIES